MSGSGFGKLFHITTFGESHGAAVGVVIDGCPAGLKLSEDDIYAELKRRRPGEGEFSSRRSEEDKPVLLSGVFEGFTTGTTVCILIWNTNMHSSDYEDIKNVFRPSHADFTYEAKYGRRDHRGGGRSSGRETAARVAAGAVAKLILSELGISVNAYVTAIGGVAADISGFRPGDARSNPLNMPEGEGAERASALLSELKESGDSAGGIVECVVKGLMPGLGEPVFDKLDAELSKAMMSIGGVKGVEFGAGFLSASMKGSENNDEFYNDNGVIRKKTNHSGGVLGGLSDGADLVFRLAVKPVPSVAHRQNTVDKDKNSVTIEIKGRHDVTIAPRIVPVAEAMAAVTLVDMIMRDRCSTVAKLKNF